MIFATPNPNQKSFFWNGFADTFMDNSCIFFAPQTAGAARDFFAVVKSIESFTHKNAQLAVSQIRQITEWSFGWNNQKFWCVIVRVLAP